MSNNTRRSLRIQERSQPEIPESHHVDEALNFSSWTVVQLRKELKARGLIASGLKADLVDRLAQSERETRMLNPREGAADIDETGSILKERMKTGKNCENGAASQFIDEEEVRRQKKIDQQRRHGIVLWRKPIVTLTYFILESWILLKDYKGRVLKHKKTVTCLVLTTVLLLLVYNIDGSHQETVSQVKSVLLWWAYWIGLGVLSSVGLGTGLHTFLLYLGPHIAGVTLAAWECGTLDFPAPPYPDEIICPDDEHSSAVNLWTIMSKVRVEAFMWGAGTALGELPPYFMARAARLSGADIDDEELEEVEELERMTNAAGQDIWTRAKKFIHDFVERVGFFGILVCASVPNPLFDLAGITCGHCLVPFWTFFGATLIGKAVIKMHLQQTFVILSFSKQYVEAVLNFVGNIPTIGPYIQKPFKIAFEKQKEKLHRKSTGGKTISEPNILAWIFEKLVIAMIIYFVLSIVNSMAQAYAKRLDEKRRQTPKPSAAKAE